MRPAFVLAAALALSSCAVGPDFERPAPPATDRYTREPLPQDTASSLVGGGDAQQFVRGMDIPGQWWTVFRSQALNDLIARALRANPTLQAAQAALRVAQENVAVGRAAYFPAIEASASSARRSRRRT